LKICAAGDCVLNAPFSGEPCPPAFRRDQGGARRRAQPIMNGNAPGGKKELHRGSVVGRGMRSLAQPLFQLNNFRRKNARPPVPTKTNVHGSGVDAPGEFEDEGSLPMYMNS